MLVPIACRFGTYSLPAHLALAHFVQVPYDQWFLTHLDDNSKIRQVKLWFLSKCNLAQSPGPQTQRPVSPITFASSIRSRSSLDSLDDGYNEDDEYSDQDSPPRHPAPSKPRLHPSLEPKPGPSSQSVQPGSSPLVDQYTLISFSTGSVLEDEFTLSWYNLRPYELLEMHPLGIVAPLQRDVMVEYIQPYFLAKVRVLRAVWDHRSGRFEAPGFDPQREHGGYKGKDKLAHRLDTMSPKPNTLQSEKGRKTKLDWKTRWVVINHGILSLCKEHMTSPPLHQFALSTIRALRGAEAFERAFSIVTQPRVVCIKFQARSLSLMGVASRPPSSPSSPISANIKTDVQGPLPHVDSACDSKQTTEQEGSGECAYDHSEGWREGGEWIVLDMLDDHASYPISSSFVSSSIITVSHSPMSSPVGTSFLSYDTIPYPEWRINTVENARKAGMGDVGKAMAWVLWTEKGLGETLLGNIRQHRQAFSREMQYKTSTIPSHIYGSEDESEEDTEMEWEGWMRDLKRQGQVKEKARRSGASMSPPSSPLSDASPSGSPRVRPPTLAVSHLPPSSYPHAQYPNIGNVIQASYRSTEFARSPDKIKSTIVSTVSMGMASSSRRRSSTLSADTRKREQDKGKQDREPSFPSVPVGGARTADPQRPPNTTVRHVHSSSNLRMSSPYESDAALPPGHPGSTWPSKRQNAFMRGVSVRAGRIVRGLESAIDFVDDKSE
ncbi:hypothetical protein J3R82DRAFT_11452 [Butyriboletus roseoflavus]|nr:hypothetical protein J3R82DRAFT_11452 [Butyriboletus roseoflavus]